MKDYSLDKDEKSKYILNVQSNLDHTFDVYFADGSVFRGVEGTSENYRKVKYILEKQAKDALLHYKDFEKKSVKSIVKTGVNAIGVVTAARLLCNLPKIKDIVEKEPPLVVFCGAGAITLLGTFPSIVKAVRDSKKCEELEKIDFRNHHRRELDSISNYPNSLSGIRPSIKHMIKTDQDPFSMINIDQYKKEDLEIIVDNIQKEECFQFTYKKKNVRNRT